jgi:pimeloyl-ACP methyl ester carboxylesterase
VGRTCICCASLRQAPYCRALAASGHTVITFDPRLNGASYPAPDAPEQFPSEPHDSQAFAQEDRIRCLRAWPQVGWMHYAADVASAMLRLAQEAPSAPMYYIGNSLGAHMLPPALAYLRAEKRHGGAEAAERLKRALFVGGNSPHFGYNEDPAALVHVYEATLDDVVAEGYGVTSRVGLGLDIPRRALEDWVRLRALLLSEGSGSSPSRR